MAVETGIEWCDSTFNPWEGCQKVGPGCDHCYAEARNARFGGGTAVNWGPGATRRRTSAANWRKPLQWQRDAAAFQAALGRRQRVFCASLADWLDNQVPVEWLVDLLELVRSTPHLDWLMLTKRVGIALQRLRDALAWVFTNARDRLRDLMQWLADWLDGQPPANVWIGATVVNQEEADRDIQKLLAAPASVRFLSIEPMLGPIDLTDITLRRGTGDEEHFDALYFDGDAEDEPDLGTETLDWVICGGESGPGARPMHPEWARSLQQQCKDAGIAFMMKQMGGVRDKRGALEDLPEDLRVREFPQ